jgi:hypothetical protein
MPVELAQVLVFIAASTGLTTHESKRNVVEILFIKAHVILGAGTGAAALASTGGCAYFASFAATATQELDVIGDYIYLGTFGAVLCLPGTVLQLALDEDRFAFLFVVSDGLAELPPGGDVEEVYLFALGAHPVYRDAELANRDAVVRKPELGVPGEVSREDHPIKADHLCILLS